MKRKLLAMAIATEMLTLMPMATEKEAEDKSTATPTLMERNK